MLYFLKHMKAFFSLFFGIFLFSGLLCFGEVSAFGENTFSCCSFEERESDSDTNCGCCLSKNTPFSASLLLQKQLDIPSFSFEEKKLFLSFSLLSQKESSPLLFFQRYHRFQSFLL